VQEGVADLVGGEVVGRAGKLIGKAVVKVAPGLATTVSDALAKLGQKASGIIESAKDALGKGEVPNSGVWQLNPFERGKVIEQALGHNLPSNYPVIDKFENGLATSIKSLDLNAATYQSTSTLSRTLTGYVDSVASFQGRTWAGVRISAQDISGRALDLVVPGPGTAAQQAAIEQAVEYAASKGVKLNVVHYP
jgi:filamentous hemagglutinin